MIFGKIAYGQAQAPQRIGRAAHRDAGQARSAHGRDGGRPRLAGRHRRRPAVAWRSGRSWALARAIVKRPDILVLYDPLGPLDQREQIEVRDALLEAFGRPDGDLGAAARRVGECLRSGDRARGGAAGPSGAARRRRGSAGRACQASHRRIDSEPRMTLQQDVDVLRKIPLFAKIEPARLKLLAFTSEHVEFRSGEAICRQGEPGDAAYIVLEGSADVVVQAERRPDDGGADRPQRHRRRDRHPVRRAAHRHRGRDHAAGGPARVQGRLLQSRHPVPAGRRRGDARAGLAPACRPRSA